MSKKILIPTIIGVLAAIIGLTAVTALLIIEEDWAWYAIASFILLGAGVETTRGSLVFLNAEARKNKPEEYWAIMGMTILITGFLQWGIVDHFDGMTMYLATAANWLVVIAEYSLSTAIVQDNDLIDSLNRKNTEIAELKKKLDTIPQTEVNEHDQKILNVVKAANLLAINGKKAIACRNGHLNVARSNKHVPKTCSTCGCGL